MDNRPLCKAKNITLLKRIIGENLRDLGLGRDFPDMTQKAQLLKN